MGICKNCGATSPSIQDDTLCFVCDYYAKYKVPEWISVEYQFFDYKYQSQDIIHVGTSDTTVTHFYCMKCGYVTRDPDNHVCPTAGICW